MTYQWTRDPDDHSTWLLYVDGKRSEIGVTRALCQPEMYAPIHLESGDPMDGEDFDWSDLEGAQKLAESWHEEMPPERGSAEWDFEKSLHDAEIKQGIENEEE